jgi:hypothetical protein
VGRGVFTPRADESAVDFVGRVWMDPLLAGPVVTTVGGVPEGIGSAWMTEFRGLIRVA